MYILVYIYIYIYIYLQRERGRQRLPITYCTWVACTLDDDICVKPIQDTMKSLDDGGFAVVLPTKGPIARAI